MRRHLHQESEARNCQEIEELKRRCCQEVIAARQQKLDELNAQQNQDSFQDQVRRLQERQEFIEHSRIFQDPDSPCSYGSTPLLIKLVLLRVPESQAAKQERRELHELI